MTETAPSSDIELLKRVSESDSKSLESLYNRYSPILYTLIKKIVTDEDVAGDILSDVFVIIWKKANLFDFESENVYAWLVTLARNKAVDSLRRKNGEPDLQEYSDEYENEFIVPRLSSTIDPLDLETAMKTKDNLENAFKNLTDAQKYVINLGFYEGMTEKQIAGKLKIPLPTVKSKIKVALNVLKENLVKGG